MTTSSFRRRILEGEKMQRARYNGFVMEVYPEGVGWKYYIHDFDYPELDCFGSLESEHEAKTKAIHCVNVQGAKVGRRRSSDPQVWAEASGHGRNVVETEAFAVAGTR
jgi:hypothetical protein